MVICVVLSFSFYCLVGEGNGSRANWSGQVPNIWEACMPLSAATTWCVWLEMRCTVYAHAGYHIYLEREWAIPLFNRTPLQMTIIANVYPRDNL